MSTPNLPPQPPGGGPTPPIVFSLGSCLALLHFLASALRDLLILWLPRWMTVLFLPRGSYAFLIHPRDLSDISARFPMARQLPPPWVEWFAARLWPVLATRINGLRSVHSGEEKIGYIVAHTLTPKQMHFDKRLAKRRILQTVQLAEKLGCRLIGLGALSASMSKGGEYLTNRSRLGITTGYAYTAAIILQMIEEVAQLLEVGTGQLTVAIVGAAGYMGTPCAEILAEKKTVGGLLLVDRPMKREALEQLRQLCSQSVPTEIATQLSSLQQADFVIVVTNSVEILVRSEHLKAGAVVFDDSQPRNTSEELLWQRTDVLILDVMAHAPGIQIDFPFDFPYAGDVFTCLGETLILAGHEWTDHYAIGHFDPKLVHQITQWGKGLGLHTAKLRSFNKPVSEERIEQIKALYQRRSTLSKGQASKTWTSKTA